MIIGSHKDKAGRTWKLKVNAKGEKHEWHAIISPLDDGTLMPCNMRQALQSTSLASGKN